MVGTHHLDRFAAEQAVAVEHAAVEQQLGEAQIVAKGRNEAAAARDKNGGFGEAAVVGRVLQFDFLGLLSGNGLFRYGFSNCARYHDRN